MKHLSPLRYPGGKSSLSKLLADVIDLNDLRGCAYFEPYAGGAGAALSLLQQDVVSDLYLNDADVRISGFWRAIFNSNDAFVEKIRTVPLSIEEWRYQNSICSRPAKHSQFNIGFAAFYMNRCNRSGVLTGSGPIGGYEQKGTWRLGVRFNRDSLCERVMELGRLRKQIHVSSLDAILFLKRMLPRGKERRRVLVYLDPPYVSNGQRLYLNSYESKDHAQLARYLNHQAVLPWIMSYDDSQLIRDLYAQQRISMMTIRYSLAKKRSAEEIIIAPDYLAVPHGHRTYGNQVRSPRAK